MITRAPLTVRPAAVAAAVGLLLALLAPGLGAQELDGTWTLTTDGPRGPMTMTLVLEQTGTELAGTVAISPPGGGRQPVPAGGREPTETPGGGRGPGETPIADGAVTGSAFTFTTTMRRRENSVTQTFSGTIDGDEITGTIVDGRGERPFSGRRGGG